MDQAIRGAMLSFKDDPFVVGSEAAMDYMEDAIIVIKNGLIADVGEASKLLPLLDDDLPLTHYTNSLILPGFIDCHVHYPQTQIIGAFGKQLIDWLNKYTFNAEMQFADKKHAREVAQVFLKESLRAGTTTSSVFCTSYPGSVDAFFEVSETLNMRNIAGKVMMDRNAPEGLLDTPQTSYDDSKALIERWHNKGRQLYSVTPRFAPTSSPEQMEMAGALRKEFSDVFLQTHVSENVNEIAWVNELYPNCAGYVDVYNQFGQLGERSILGHGVHLREDEFQLLHDTGTAIAHCPSSNLFLGSGLFSIEKAKQSDRPVHVGLATDLGAGTNFSMMAQLNETYKVAIMNQYSLGAAHAFYLATLGSARALYLDQQIGSIEVGKEADLAVIDLHSTPVIDYRMKYAQDIHEALFIQMTMADDRSAIATYVAGKRLYHRTNNEDSFAEEVI